MDINFVSKKNEDYHIANQAKIANMRSSFSGSFQAAKFSLSEAQNSIGYTASQIIGIDSVLGDILFDPNEIPVIKGGFYDRNHTFYSDDINNSGLKSVNVLYQGTVDASQRPSITTT